MKLKRLDITGFKSFCEKVSIEFPAGISAIVGPNGCGKSNLVDAIRWVMGEQSAKQLRGKIMEDVIFAGAGGIPPVNMAEVSLTLLNDNRTAPEELKEFSEIMITRRVFRSGERVYLLNKRPCRLKDIYNLFLGSGMGAKSYAVIQQGNIGAITEAEPGERRVFIEEAAGITRYKKSKLEALRKVDATNQNLLRVEDIIVEVKRHMSSLKRQARKAELYQSYRERIQRIDILLAIDAHHDLSGQITDTDKLLKSLRDDDLRHTSKIKRLDAAVEELKLLCLEKNQNISEQQSAKIDAQRKTDRLENDLEHLRNEMLRLKDEVLEQKSAQRGLNEKYSEITAEIEQIKSEEMIFLDKIEKTRASLCLEQKKNQYIKNSLSDLNQKLDKHKNSLIDSAALEASHRNIYQNAAIRKEKIERRLKRAEEDVYSANRRIEEAASIEQKAKKNFGAINRRRKQT
jgi:chromosome segregation protein